MPRSANPGDERRRALERAVATGGGPAEKARLLLERARAGEISALHIEVAAALGHPIARLVLGDSAPEVLKRDYDQRLRAAAGLAGPCAALAWGADSLERALPLVADDPVVTKVTKDAIAAAREIAEKGSFPKRKAEKIRDATSDAHEEAVGFSIAKSVTDGADSLAVGVTWFDPKSEDPERLANSMSIQAHGAVSDVCAAFYRAAEPLPPGEAGPKTPARQKAFDDEKAWAMGRLAEYLLGERVVGCKLPGDGGEWVRIRDEDEAEERRIKQIIEEALQEKFQKKGKRKNEPMRANSDERLRQLERAWVESPRDERALNAYVRELERTGRAPSMWAASLAVDLTTVADAELDLLYAIGNLRPTSGERIGRLEAITREMQRRLPPLPVIIRAWEDPSEQRRRLRPGETERFWVRLHGPGEFDPSLVERVLREAGARIAPRTREWGELHRTETAVFSGITPAEAERAMREAGLYFHAERKTWGGDALPEARRSPSLILLFPTEACAPPDQCDSAMWQEDRGQWSIGSHECADYHGVLGRTRSATASEYTPAVQAYEREFGRRLKVYARSSYEFDRIRRERAREHGY